MSRVTMVFWPVRSFLFSCVAASLTATATLAQDANYSSVEATSDMPVQLSYHASAHKDWHRFKSCFTWLAPAMRERTTSNTR
jgi:hypothetical protein